MNLVAFAAFLIVCDAAKLDRTYLPPPSAAFAGGNSGFLQAPFQSRNTGFSHNPFARVGGNDQSFQFPKGGYVNDHQGVVVEAAAPGTRASNQASGLGAPRISYGSTDSKVGDAAFRGTKFLTQSTQVHPVFHSQFGPRIPPSGLGDTDLNPDLSAFHQVPSNRPKVDQLLRDHVPNTIRYQSTMGRNKFKYAFETENGIKMEENGESVNGMKTHGGYSYTGDDGRVYSVEFTADKDGFRPKGAHLPTPPPIPLEILQSLEQNARDEAAGVIDDGSYDARKYNEDGDDTQSDDNGKYNDRQSNKFGGRPGFDSDRSGINQNKQSFGKPSTNSQFGSGDMSKNSQQSKPGIQFGTGINTYEHTFIVGNGLPTSVQTGQLSNSVFNSQNQYLPPFVHFQTPQIQSSNSFPGLTNYHDKQINYNISPNLPLSHQKLQIQGPLNRPLSAPSRPSNYDTSIQTLTSPTPSMLPAYIQNQALLNDFESNKNKQPFLSPSLNKQPVHVITQEMYQQSVSSNSQINHALSGQILSKPNNYEDSIQHLPQYFNFGPSLPAHPNYDNKPSQQVFSSSSTASPLFQSIDESMGQFHQNLQVQKFNNTPNKIDNIASTFLQSPVPTNVPQLILTTPLESNEPIASVFPTSSDLTKPYQTSLPATVFSSKPLPSQQKLPLETRFEPNKEISTTPLPSSAIKDTDTNILSTVSLDSLIFGNEDVSQSFDNKFVLTQTTLPSIGTNVINFTSTSKDPSQSGVSQFIGQSQSPDGAYIYNRPIKPFNTQSEHPSVLSSPGNRVTQPFVFSDNTMLTNAPDDLQTQNKDLTLISSPLPTLPSISTVNEDKILNQTQASILSFPVVIPTTSSNSQPIQQSVLLNTPSLEPFYETVPTSATATAQIFTSESDYEDFTSEFGQRLPVNKVTSQDSSTTLQVQEYTGEVNEYTQPIVNFSTSSQKETTDVPKASNEFNSSITIQNDQPTIRPTQEAQIDTQSTVQEIESSPLNGQTTLPYGQKVTQSQFDKQTKTPFGQLKPTSVFDKQTSSSSGQKTTPLQFDSQLNSSFGQKKTPSRVNIQTGTSISQESTLSQFSEQTTSTFGQETTQSDIDIQSTNTPMLQTIVSRFGSQPSSSLSQSTTSSLINTQTGSLIEQEPTMSRFDEQMTLSLGQQTTSSTFDIQTSKAQPTISSQFGVQPTPFELQTTPTQFGVQTSPVFVQQTTASPTDLLPTTNFIQDATRQITSPQSSTSYGEKTEQPIGTISQFQQTNTQFNNESSTTLPTTSGTKDRVDQDGLQNTGAGNIYEYNKPTTSFSTTSQAESDVPTSNLSSESDHATPEGFTIFTLGQQLSTTFQEDDTTKNDNKIEQQVQDLSQTMSTLPIQESQSTISLQPEYEVNLQKLTTASQKEDTVTPNQINESNLQFSQTLDPGLQSTFDQQTFSTVSLTGAGAETRPTQQSQLTTQFNQQSFPTTLQENASPFSYLTTQFSDRQTDSLGEVYEYNKPAQTLSPTSQTENNEQTMEQTQSTYSDTEGTQTLFDTMKSTVSHFSQDVKPTVQSQNGDSILQEIGVNKDLQKITTEKEGVNPDSRPQLSFQSACCGRFKIQKDQSSTPPRNKSLDLGGKKPENGSTSVTNEEEPKVTTVSFVGKGEEFGGPRKPPSFDKSGYHY